MISRHGSIAQPPAPAGPLRNPPTDRATRAQREAEHDAGLVRRFLAGEEAAFAEIVRRYRSRMIQVAYSILGNRADAEEMAQDTFVRAWRALKWFRGDSSLSSWLYRVAINLAKNRRGYFLRRRQDRMVSLDAPHTTGASETYGEAIEGPTPSPAAEVARHEFSQAIGAGLERLTPEHRQILDLLTLRHRSYDEISAELGVEAGTIKSRISRARTRLRGAIAEHHPEFEANGPINDWFEPVRSLGRVKLCA